MATKKSSKKSKTTKKSSSTGQSRASAELTPNELKIRFEHPSQILPELLELAQQLSETHDELLIQPATAVEVDVLGATRARLIVSSCAQSTAWGATLAELGLNPLIFRNCVAAGVDAAGYVPPAGDKRDLHLDREGERARCRPAPLSIQSTPLHENRP